MTFLVHHRASPRSDGRWSGDDLRMTLIVEAKVKCELATRSAGSEQMFHRSLRQRARSPSPRPRPSLGGHPWAAFAASSCRR
jgi:hypothetical protein